MEKGHPGIGEHVEGAAVKVWAPGSICPGAFLMAGAR